MKHIIKKSFVIHLGLGCIAGYSAIAHTQEHADALAITRGDRNQYQVSYANQQYLDHLMQMANQLDDMLGKAPRPTDCNADAQPPSPFDPADLEVIRRCVCVIKEQLKCICFKIETIQDELEECCSTIDSNFESLNDKVDACCSNLDAGIQSLSDQLGDCCSNLDQRLDTIEDRLINCCSNLDQRLQSLSEDLADCCSNLDAGIQSLQDGFTNCCSNLDADIGSLSDKVGDCCSVIDANFNVVITTLDGIVIQLINIEDILIDIDVNITFITGVVTQIEVLAESILEKVCDIDEQLRNCCSSLDSTIRACCSILDEQINGDLQVCCSILDQQQDLALCMILQSLDEIKPPLGALGNRSDDATCFEETDFCCLKQAVNNAELSIIGWLKTLFLELRGCACASACETIVPIP